MGKGKGPLDTTIVDQPEHDSMMFSVSRETAPLALVLVWSREEPGRVGEVMCFPNQATTRSFVIGRAIEPDETGDIPMHLTRLRPFSREVTGPFRAARVSRKQIRVRVGDDHSLICEHVGRGKMRINGKVVEKGVVRPGGVLEAEKRFLLYCTHRPAGWPMEEAQAAPFTFGQTDTHGLVGESPAMWALREQVEFVAKRDGHVLIHGPSGSGKELVARAIHALSRRSDSALVARNAATIPETLVDAELFGNMKNYPNPGMPVRVGLLGEADKSSLFLDEIGELPHAMQAHMLRVMDSGEYQRLGESKPRTSDFRLIAATNRDPDELKHDFLARFTHRIEVGGFEVRQEDTVLVARHLLKEIATNDPAETERFLREGEPRLSPDLVYALVWHGFNTHVRELSELLWRSLATSPGQYLLPPPGLAIRTPKHAIEVKPFVDPATITKEQVDEALERCGGVKEKVWRELGLRNRFQLNRLLKKFAETAS